MKEHFKEITRTHIYTCEDIISQGGACLGVNCLDCPFSSANSVYEPARTCCNYFGRRPKRAGEEDDKLVENCQKIIDEYYSERKVAPNDVRTILGNKLKEASKDKKDKVKKVEITIEDYSGLDLDSLVKKIEIISDKIAEKTFGDTFEPLEIAKCYLELADIENIVNKLSNEKDN